MSMALTLPEWPPSSRSCTRFESKTRMTFVCPEKSTPSAIFSWNTGPSVTSRIVFFVSSIVSLSVPSIEPLYSALPLSASDTTAAECAHRPMCGIVLCGISAESATCICCSCVRSSWISIACSVMYSRIASNGHCAMCA